MTDLTKIDKQFGELDIETKLALHRAFYDGMDIEVYVAEFSEFRVITPPLWKPYSTYRVAPEPLRDIQVPWHVFGPEVRAVARDKNGTVCAYCGEEPDRDNSQWKPNNSEYFRIDELHLIGFDPGNKPWDQSLVRRPEGV